MITQRVKNYLQYKENLKLIPIGSKWKNEFGCRTIIEVNSQIVIFQYETPRYQEIITSSFGHFIFYVKTHCERIL